MIDIKGYESIYAITENGEVYSYRNKKFIKPVQKKNGYVYIQLNYKGKNTYRLHRLVAETYVLNPENKPFVNHIDGVKNNNHYTNLEWVNGTENNLHAIQTGLVELEDYWDVWYKEEFVGKYKGYKEIINIFGLKKNTIANSIRYKRPTRSGFLIERSTTIS